jgi:hypothetical protein
MYSKLFESLPIPSLSCYIDQYCTGLVRETDYKGSGLQAYFNYADGSCIVYGNMWIEASSREMSAY